MVIILANVVDQILGLNGAVTYATVLFYLANEGLSILENLAAVGVTVPGGLEKRLKTIQEQDKTEITSEIKEEFTTKRSGQNEN